MLASFSSDIWALFSIGIVIVAGLYFAFSLIVLRQVSLMTNTVQTEGGPILKALALVHAVFALGVIILLISWLF